MEPLFDVAAFVKDNAPYLTIADMVDETGLPRYEIQKACDKLNITPISKSEQTKANIKYWADKKTLEEFVKMSSLGEAGIKVYCKQLGIEFLANSKKRQTAEEDYSLPTGPVQSTIAKRLSTVRFYSDGISWEQKLSLLRSGKGSEEE